MRNLSEAQKLALGMLDSAKGQPKCAYELKASLATLRALCRLGYAKDVTKPGPGDMFSPRTHYEFVWRFGERKP